MNASVVPLIDPALPGLSAALDIDVMSALLFEILAGASADPPPGRLIAASVLKHTPGRRCAIAYRVEECGRERKLFAKTFHTDRGASIFDGMTRVAASLAGGPVVVPRPVAYWAPLKLLVTEFLEGDRLSTVLYRGTSVEPTLRMAGAIAALHRSGADLARSWTVEDELDTTRRAITSLRRGGARRAMRLLRVLERLAASLPQVHPAPIHRDFYPDQLLDCGGSTALLDLDDMRSGDPSVDLGNFVAHLTLRPIQFPEMERGCTTARGIFLAEYLRLRAEEVGQCALLERIRFYEAASLLRLSGVYGARSKWAKTIPPGLLESCELLLQRGRS